MTVTTTTTWEVAPDFKLHSDLIAARDQWIKTAIEQGKTSELYARPADGNSFTRTWKDQAAADEWKAFITNAATANGLNVTVA